jgi:tetratricopeptide (TPR) repeat protein
MKRMLAAASLLALALLLPAALCAESVANLKTAADVAVKAAVAAPADYGANWKAAKALRLYGDTAETQAVTGWQDIAKSVGKEGMKYGEIAQKLNPTGIEGWYYYGLCVATYSDGVSILTALAEGLKGKTQTAFETSYKMDKMFDDGGPILSLARFWQVLPGIAGRDRAKAEKLLNEYLASFATSPNANKDAWFFRGELYRDTGRSAEAKLDFQKAASMGKKEAAEALAKLK